MKDTLTKLNYDKKKLEKRVTSENKKSMINLMNKNAKEYGYNKISKNASVQDVQNFKKTYVERLTYDIVTTAIQRGNTIVADIQSRDLKKSTDFENKKLGEYAKQLAEAKKESNKHLSKDDINFLERGNQNISGYGNKDIITLFENAKSKKDIENLIVNVKNQDPSETFYQKQTDLFERVFQKVGIVREDDINKIKERIKQMDMQKALDTSNTLLMSLEMYGSPDNDIGEYNGDETELANARLDDMLIRLGEKKTGSRKVKKTMEKYKSKYNEKSGFIY